MACDPAASAAACASPNGWVVNLADSGERVNVDMKLAVGTLVIASNVPQSNACEEGGYAWFNYLDFASGNAVTSSPNGVVSERLRIQAMSAGDATEFRENGVYLVTGGMGALGQILARHLCGHYRARVYLTGRSAPSDAQQSILAELCAIGGHASYLQCDVAERDDGCAGDIAEAAFAGGRGERREDRRHGRGHDRLDGRPPTQDH